MGGPIFVGETLWVHEISGCGYLVCTARRLLRCELFISCYCTLRDKFNTFSKSGHRTS
ncbi:hypothetical protein PISMIDRAFT_689386 [Pisolithus microcarpus 441]|uniref:Uncharacterized protein n=1 Tax=Pisolithus microcarpus 441 TaxID=765257 RepID=A0A0C9YQC3_9AGAM|nr:hypothetical protein PISMIDRAFT_689386 [Pisolithus microcarpus 441]